MPQNWKTYKLGEILEYQKGFAFKSSWYENEGRLIVRVSDTTNDSIDVSTCNKIDELKAIELEKYSLKQKDIVIATVGSWPPNYASVVGKVIKVPNEASGSLLNQNAVRLRVNNASNQDQSYLYYLMKSPSFMKYIINSAQGSANQASIKLTDIFNYEFDLPPLPEQRAIAEILSSLDDKIELNLQMNKTLEEMAMTLYKHWFVDFEFPISTNTSPPFKEESPQGEVVFSTPSQESPQGEEVFSTLKQEYPQGEEVFSTFQTSDKNHPVLRTPLLEKRGSRGAYKSSGSKFIDSELGPIPEGWEVKKLGELLEIKYGKDHKKLEVGNIPVYGSGGIMRYVNQFLYDEESILIPRKGTLSNLFYLRNPFWSVDTMFYTKLNESQTGKYIFYFLKTLDLAGMDVGSAVPSLTTQLLKNIDIVVPSTEITSSFDVSVSRFFDTMEENIKENQTLTTLRDTLLPKLISGEIRVKDAEQTLSEVL